MGASSIARLKYCPYRPRTESSSFPRVVADPVLENDFDILDI